MKLFNDDCLKVLPTIPDKSIDLILTDPPYGTTACKWDSIIPLDKMWFELKRIIKDNSAIVFKHLNLSQQF
jgi:site-specific DNA-methyltransferase (adenine-specific)